MFLFPAAPPKPHLQMSHLATAGTNSSTGNGGTWSSTITCNPGKTLLALSTARSDTSDFDLTLRLGGNTITPFVKYEASGYDQRGTCIVYVADTPTGGTLSLEVDNDIAVDYYKVDSFSISGGVKISDQTTGTNADANLSLNVDAPVNGYLLAITTSIQNNGPSNDVFVGICGLDAYPNGVTNQTVTLNHGSGTALSTPTISGVTEVGTRYGHAGSWNYSDGVQMLLLGLEAA